MVIVRYFEVVFMEYKYGEFFDEQIQNEKIKLRKAIFFLLLIADPKTNKEYENVNVVNAFLNVQYEIDGLNELFFESSELVRISSLLERALMEYQSDTYQYEVYRKLVLDAGAEVLHIKAGDKYAEL